MKKYYIFDLEVDEDNFMETMEQALQQELDIWGRPEDKVNELKTNVLNGQSEEIDGITFSIIDEPLVK